MKFINSILPSVSQTLSYLTGSAVDENLNDHDGNTKEGKGNEIERTEEEDAPPSSIPAGLNDEAMICNSVVSSLGELESGTVPTHERTIATLKSTHNAVELMNYDSDDEVEDIIAADQVHGQYDLNQRTKRAFLKQSRRPRQATPKSSHILMSGTIVSSTKSTLDGKTFSQTDPSSDATLSSYPSDTTDEKCIQDLYSDFEKRRYKRYVKKVVTIFMAVLCVIIAVVAVFVAIELSQPDVDEKTLLSNWGVSKSNQKDQPQTVIPSKQPSGLDSTGPTSNGDDYAATQDPVGSPIGNSPSTSPVKSLPDVPSASPVESLTDSPSASQVDSSTEFPITQPVFENDDEDVFALTATFYVIGDLPYNDKERTRLIEIVNNVPDDAEFLVHVGDIRDAEQKTDCLHSEFDDVGSILKNSSVPVFIVPGDNEYNDCPNLDESWGDWMGVFGNFESNWDSPIKSSRDPARPENFFFVHKRVLYIGLNIVGGTRHSYSEWEGRLSDEYAWTKDLIDRFLVQPENDASSVVIFAHGDPDPSAHASFFGPLQYYIANDLENKIPIIYVNGDKHYFQFDPAWYGQESLHRVMVEGGSKEPPLQMKLSVPKSWDHGVLQVDDVYSIDRQL
ncbi:MAG: hypothetical protein SGBAC_009050 [Bacillariaceae sp.]